MTQVTEQAITAAARAMFAKGRGGNDDPPDFDSASQEMQDWISGIAEAALTAALPHLLPAPSQSDEELWRDLCERPDRTSPEDQPDMALINQAEFFGYLAAVRAEERALHPAPSQSDKQRARDVACAIRDRWNNSDPCGLPFEDAVAWIAAVLVEQRASASSQSDEEAASTLLFGRPNIGVDPESVFSVRYKLLVSFLAEFRAAVRAEATLAERERCAKVAQTHSHVGGEDYDLGYLDGRADAATLIRATS